MKKIFTLTYFVLVLTSVGVVAQTQYNASTYHQFNTNSGWVQLGAQNSGWAHIYTDRPAVIFNKPVYSIGGSFSSYNTDNLYLQTGGTTRMTIKNDGTAAIGTSDPGGATLKVYNGSLPSFELQSSISRLQIGMATSDWSFAYGARSGDAVLRTLGGTNSMVLYMPSSNNDGNSYIAFGDDANNLWMKIFNNKVVRIAGTLVANRIQVRTDVWSDYVFDPNYKLSSLDEIEAFIKEKKHLPEVPSASQVIEEGIDVAQMNAILLKKIEELTLLMIEQNKTIKDLQNKVNDLQK